MKINLGNWLSALCAILLIVLLVLQNKQKNQLETLRQEHEDFVKATTQSQQEAKATAAEMANAIQQQTAVVHRAIGKIIPVELPASLTNKLAALEARIGDESSWPKDSTNTDVMIAELRDLVRQLPPWAEEDYLPRLNALRWGASALTLVAKAQTVTDDALEDYLDDVDAAIQAEPDGASELVAKRLAEIQANPDFKKRVQKLQQDFQKRVLSDDTSKFIASVDAGLVRATNEPTLTVRQIWFGQLLNSVVSQRQILLENTNADASLPGRLTTLAARIEKVMEADVKSQEADQEKKSRAYQRWALTQIQQFNVAFEATKNKQVTERKEEAQKFRSKFAFTAASGGIFVWALNYGASEALAYAKVDLQYKAVAGAMQTFLLPISSEYLDPAVSHLYYEAFDRGWKKLENQKHMQTEVAEQEAVIQKQKP